MNNPIRKFKNYKDEIYCDGGNTAIFRTIACIGDSLSSGEFERKENDGTTTFHDMYEYSWGQFIGRMTGAKVYNLSRGGMTAKEYVETFAEENNYWKVEAQAYIIALGVNDFIVRGYDVGSVDDCDIDSDSFSHYYGTIIKKYQELSKDSKFFFVSMPRENDNEKNEIYRSKLNKLLTNFTKKFPNSYLIDLYHYAPIYDKEFKDYYFLEGHLNPCGYLYTAKMISSYIDCIIRENYNDFRRVSFIGKE